MRPIRSAVLCLALLSAPAGCGDDGSTPDAGRPDAGTTDAGPSGRDAGPAGEDAGPGVEDAGPGVEDAGPGVEDAGPGVEDAGPGEDAGGGGDAGGDDAGPTLEVDCAGVVHLVFPEFDRSCETTEDCGIAVHQYNCCGSKEALGIAASELAAFEAAEAICRPMYDRCLCPEAPTEADDGTTDMGIPAIVGCSAEGQCQTHFPPAS